MTGRIIEKLADDLVIREFTPQDTGAITDGQLELYAREYGLTTEIWRGYLIGAVKEFVDRFDPERDWLAVVDHAGTVQGAAAITHTDPETAQFRFFFMAPALRGKGLGQKLFDQSVEFCHSRGYRRIFLWTFSTLDAARHLYKQKGFTITETKEHDDWGPLLTEERWDLEICPNGRETIPNPS
jgi:GNAT superfamily N-acetyltransferase